MPGRRGQEELQATLKCSDAYLLQASLLSVLILLRLLGLPGQGLCSELLAAIECLQYDERIVHPTLS